MFGIDAATDPILTNPWAVGGLFSVMLGFVLWIAKGAIEKTYSDAAESRVAFTATMASQQQLFKDVLDRIEMRAEAANTKIVDQLRKLGDQVQRLSDHEVQS